jgi:hypothetical protein
MRREPNYAVSKIQHFDILGFRSLRDLGDL